MSSSKKSTRSSRAFAPRLAEELEYEDLAFSKYEDLFENVDEGLIRKYIEDEAHAVKEQKDNDLQELHMEHKDLHVTIEGLEKEANELEERANQAAERQAVADDKIATLKEQVMAIKSQDAEKKAQISDCSGLASDMNEQKNKWVKDVDKKNMEEINKAMTAGAEKEQAFILDSLAKFFTGNPDANYAANQEEFFADNIAFGAAVRKVKPERLDRESCKEIAHRVNQDGEGVIGDVQNYMTDTNRVAQNLPFYPHFKLLFKITQMAISIRKKDGLVRKLAGSSDSTKKISINMDTQVAISKNLDFGKQLRAEADRMRNEEIAALQHKSDSLQEEIQKLEGTDFVKEYFQELISAK